MISLRPYQQQAIDDLAAQFAAGYRRVLLVASTGAGKTVMFTRVAKGARGKGLRVLILAHRERIIEQIGASLRAQGVRHGWIAQGRSQTDDAVQVGMVQTVARRVDRIAPPDLIVIDEAHHSPSATYQAVLAAFPGAKVLGVTATPARVDGRGLGDVFEALVEAPPMRALIEMGALARYRYLAPPAQLDLSRVSKRRGDYVVSELEAEMDRARITGDVVAHYRKHLAGAPSVVFCTSVKAAEETAAAFRDGGFRACSVDGKLDRAEQARRLNALADGSAQVVTSCDLISEGVDVPGIVGCFLLRATASLAVHLQQVGRALRPKPDGSPAVIFDHVGNVTRHGLPDAAREWSLDGKSKSQREVQVAECERCYRVFERVPGWKADIACPDPGSGCILEDSADRGGSREVRTVDGELVEMGDAPEWTGGVSLASGDLTTLVRRANGLRELHEIERARGYKHGWAFKTYQRRRGTTSAAAPGR